MRLKYNENLCFKLNYVEYIKNIYFYLKLKPFLPLYYINFKILIHAFIIPG